MVHVFTRQPWTGVEVRRNCLPNPSGRVDTTGYTAIGTGASISIDVGVDSYVLTTTVGIGAGNFGIRLATLEVGVDVDPSTVYRFTADAVALLSPSTARPWALYVTGSGVPLSVAEYHAASDWDRAEVDFTTAVSGDVEVYIVNDAPTVAGSNVVAFRDANVEKLSTFSAALPYFAGHFTDTPSVHYEWTGDANDSATVIMLPAPDDQVTPLTVIAPYTAGRETRSIRHTLLQSAEPRFTFIPPTHMGGVLDLGFDSAADARDAVEFFSGRYEFWFDADDLPEVSRLFAVAGGQIELEQEEDARTLWHVRVPWMESLS